MRHVLIISYDFPWISAAGVIRTYQFAKNLPDFGWQPVILTAQSAAEREDNVETSDGQLSCPKFIAAPDRYLLPFRTEPHPPHQPMNGAMPAKNRLSQFFARGVSQFAVPDGKINWLRPAIKLGLQIASEYPIRACFSVSPRPTAHLVAHRLARRLHIPWVADFALPWSNAYWLANRPPFIHWLDQRLERFVANAAQFCTVAYDSLKRDMIAYYGREREDRIAVVPTGFEETLFNEPIPSSAPKFTVVYPGNHFCENGRNGEYFLRAIDEWMESEPSLQDHVEFVFIGKPDDALLSARAAMTHPNVIRVEPLKSHAACICAIRSSHTCVVNTVGNRIPAKVYECMRAGKHIIALADLGSDLEKLIRTYPKGVSISAENKSAIRNTLQNIFARIQSVNSEPNEAATTTLPVPSAKHGAETVSQIFDVLLSIRQRNKTTSESRNSLSRVTRRHQPENT